MHSPGLMSEPEAELAGEGVSRRDFLRAGSMGVVGLSLGEQAAMARFSTLGRRHVIFILMTGGPSQLDTFDPKPDAPARIRGPMRAISTRVPGLSLNEALPHLAERAQQFALIRSLNHDYAPIHETGQQLLQCGRVVESGTRFPHFGVVVSRAARRGGQLSNVVVPALLSKTGTHLERGQSAGPWGDEWNPLEWNAGFDDEPEALRKLYGDSTFGRLLLQSRQLVEQGASCVTVNLFQSLGDNITWDAHGNPACGPATVFDYRDDLGPKFDRALAGLLDDLAVRGLLDDTLVVATGEFGRAPWLNEQGGRDHWPGCWSALVAGGRISGGAVIGASDALGAAPADRPVCPSEITATLLHWFGIDSREWPVHVGDRVAPLVPAAPILELWG